MRQQPKALSQHSTKLMHRWLRETDHLVKPPPQGRVEQLLVIRCRHKETRSPVAVKHLQERIHDSLDLAVLSRIVTHPPESVELIKEHDLLPDFGAFHDTSEVCRGLSQIGRDNRIQTDDHQWDTDLSR